MKINKVNGLKGRLLIPGDKSISHRSVMFGALSEGITEVTRFLPSADCLSTISCMRKMGVTIEQLDSHTLKVHGVGLNGLKAPSETLNTGNSGTTTRLLAGILAGQNFTSRLSGDSSLNSRPMGRVMTPLTQMGGSVISENGSGCAPLIIEGHQLHGITYKTPVASAQVKSCILLAGLYADSPTTVIEPSPSRDHTERMLKIFGANLISEGVSSTITPGSRLYGHPVAVPGDISSAAYFLAAGLLIPGSEIRLDHVGINPTRDGILRVIEAMGGNVEYLEKRGESGEPEADLLVRYGRLHGTTVKGDIIPTLIDEIPMIAIMAAFADGETVIADAAELKVKETDRLALITENLTRMGADITATDDGMIIRGGSPLHGAVIETKGDHRMAMAFSIAGLLTGDMIIDDAACVDVSYPTFYESLRSLTQA